MKPPVKTWRELEAEGIKRCCAMFTNGNRCQRRAIEAFDFSWCGKHGPTMKLHIDRVNVLMKETDVD
jgi:hypothetical protein